MVFQLTEGYVQQRDKSESAVPWSTSILEDLNMLVD